LERTDAGKETNPNRIRPLQEDKPEAYLLGIIIRLFVNFPRTYFPMITGAANGAFQIGFILGQLALTGWAQRVFSPERHTLAAIVDERILVCIPTALDP
jgi:hypothetical protein